MPPEIAVAGGVGSGNHGEGIRYGGQGQLLLKIHKALFLKPLHSLTPAQFCFSEGMFNIDIVYYQGGAV